MRGLKLHRKDLTTSDQRHAEAERVADVVGLTPATDILQRFPYELSGGQRQRIGFAQALAYKPKLILADEPVSMLDVSIRIGLLNVMAKLREEEDVSFLYITHDIASARYVADRIMIMYAGHIVESGPTEAVLADQKRTPLRNSCSRRCPTREPLSRSAPRPTRASRRRSSTPRPGVVFASVARWSSRSATTSRPPCASWAHATPPPAMLRNRTPM